MIIHSNVKQNTYYDSVTLMLFSSSLSGIPGIRRAAVMMGTDHNKNLMIQSGVLTEEAAETITPNDLVIGISAESHDAVQDALKVLEDQINHKKEPAGSGETTVKSLSAAVKSAEDLNFCIISVPGKFAANEAMTALKNGLHVLLFSDNVSVEDEVRLKEYAVSRQLLMMGPDCGTAVINGVALGFANVVKRGKIGIVAASGTGLQEVTVIIDQLGGGISQALGTGGRDLKEAVGGKMMLLSLDALKKDPQTEVVLIVSKPPTRPVMKKILDSVQSIGKPVVACFLGGDESVVSEAGVIPAATLEQAAISAVALSEGKMPDAFSSFCDSPAILSLAEAETSKLNSRQKYIRGLYSGGSLCFESLLQLEQTVGSIYSNIALNPEYTLKDINISQGNTLIDMGEDYFTDGLPHPMIDTRLRTERLYQEVRDPETAVILLDCVLGYGCHEDPAGALADAVRNARSLAGDRYLCFVASVCGTDGDIQNRTAQARKLEEAGVTVMRSNAQAALLTSEILRRIEKER
jgi:succinyl-CoA synthetase alpha subunit